MLSVDCDDQSMFFKSLIGMSSRAAGKLSQEGAAELLWSKLIERLQR